MRLFLSRKRGDARIKSHLGATRMSRAATAMGSGNVYRDFFPSIARFMRAQASSHSIMNGMENSFLSVRGVRTNPGHSDIAWTPEPASSISSPSMNVVTAALEAE